MREDSASWEQFFRGMIERGLKGVRLARRGVSRRQARWLAIGTATSFASTVAATDLIRMVERDRALAPYAAYRMAFALLILLNRSR